MKLLLAAALFTVCLALGEARRCRSSDDCEPTECCVSKGFFIFKRGECKQLAQKGETCSEKHEARGFLGEQYEYHCPCAAGLICQPEIRDTWLGTLKSNPKCVVDIAHTTPAETARTEEPETTIEQRETTIEQPETTIEPESTQETQAPDDV